ncbi:CTD small phosphatase-like protein [Echinococcus granulosus]|nr:CTD small phosphatase-like protein [Echinococcus granulosus]CDS17402.1 CTD small phosphatase protein like [Echinococcus granulosus]
MSQSKHSSHDSLSPEECDRLVLSPPPAAFNPEKLKEFLSVNRTTSAKVSLHSVNTAEGTPPPPRHASVAWSRSEFDSKFKQYESEMKSAATSEALQKVHLRRISLDPSKDSEQVTASTSPISICTEQSSGVLSTPQKASRPPARGGVDGWRRFLCCVPSRAKLLEHPERLALRPILRRDESTHPNPEVFPEFTTTKITKSPNWSGLFKRQKNLSTGSTTVTAKLRSVQKLPQLADERLKSPAPTLLVTRHEASVSVPSEADHAHGDENGVAGYHVNLGDRMSESVHSQDSVRSEDSDLEPVDQVNPGQNLLGQPSPDCIGKKCLVLDLDETLVHSSFKPVENADFTVTVEVENIQHEVSVCKRPHLETFIETIGPLFEVVMFTASLSKYADPVCDRIDPSGHFKHRLFRESCDCFKSNYIKRLDVLGRDIEQICIIDNSPISFYFHRQNALQIITWYDDPQDTALLDLIPYLKGLAEAPSVLEYVSQFAPPSSAVIEQSDPSLSLFGVSGLWGGGWSSYNYDDEEEEDAEVLHDGFHGAQQRCQEGEGGLSSPHDIITMAPRPTGEAVTAT